MWRVRDVAAMAETCGAGFMKEGRLAVSFGLGFGFGGGGGCRFMVGLLLLLLLCVIVVRICCCLLFVAALGNGKRCGSERK